MNHEHHQQSTTDHSQHQQHIGHESKDSYSKHEGHSVEMFKNKLYISLALTIPVLVLSPVIHEFLRFSFRFPGDAVVLFALSSLVFFYGGLPFLKGSLNELKHKMPGMMTLIALAIIVAYVYSTAVTFGLTGEVFFWREAN